MKKTNPYSNWSPAPAVLELSPSRVDVWRVQIDIPDDSRKLLEPILSPDERERAGRFHFPADRDRFIVSHAGLREVLSRYLHCEPLELGFSEGEYGKPALVSGDGIEFNLAHSNDYALIAVARGRRVGIDVERIRSGISSNVISRQYFSKAEVADLESLPLEQRETAFFTCWTRKEAYIKGQGLGLSLPLESFDVSLSPDEPAVLRATRPDPLEAGRWKLLSLEVDPRYAAALAAEVSGQDPRVSQDAPGLEIRMWDWSFGD